MLTVSMKFLTILLDALKRMQTPVYKTLLEDEIPSGVASFTKQIPVYFVVESTS